MQRLLEEKKLRLETRSGRKSISILRSEVTRDDREVDLKRLEAAVSSSEATTVRLRALGIEVRDLNATGTLDEEMGIGLLSGIYTLAAIIPSIGVSIRRLHDIGRTGWWVLIGFVPLIGSIVLLVFALLDSQPGDNQYGANPKGV